MSKEKIKVYLYTRVSTIMQTERRNFYEKLIKEIQIYEERQPNGQWLKSIEFKLPIIEHDIKMSLDNSDSIESCVLLTRVSNRKADSYVKLNVKMEDYYRIKDAEKKTDE